MLQRDYSAAKRILENIVGQRNLQHRRIDAENLPGRLHVCGSGDNANAQKAFEQARPAFEAAVKEALKALSDTRASAGFTR